MSFCSGEVFVRLMLSDHVNSGSAEPVRAYGDLRAAEALDELADAMWDDVLAGRVSMNVVRKVRLRADELRAG